MAQTTNSSPSPTRKCPQKRKPGHFQLFIPHLNHYFNHCLKRVLHLRVSLFPISIHQRTPVLPPSASWSRALLIMGKLIRSVAFLGGAPKRSSSTLSEASKLTWHSRHPSSAAELRGHDLKHQSSVSYETSSSSEDSELSRSSLSQQKSSLKDSSPRVKTRVALPDGNG
jgi:hypothetical protein